MPHILGTGVVLMAATGALGPQPKKDRLALLRPLTPEGKPFPRPQLP